MHVVRGAHRQSGRQTTLPLYRMRRSAALAPCARERDRGAGTDDVGAGRYGGRVEWTTEVEAGQWLRERLDDPWRGTMHDVVPRGFGAYVRVFHPATRDRPVGRPWPPLPYRAHARAWADFQEARPQIDVERVSWADTAAAMGTTMHPGAQWHRLVAPGVVVENEDGPRDAAGWRYSDPLTGEAPADILAALAAPLAANTNTPHDGFVSLWEGWGDLVGHLGVGPSRVFFTPIQDAAAPSPADGVERELQERHEEMLAHSIRDPFNNPFQKPTWQPGILPDDVSRGARFALPGRAYVLFRGAVDEFCAADWVLRVPWRDREAEEHGFEPQAHAPSLIWPADHAWAMVSEVDFDSTIIAGSAELVAAICATPGLEALPIPTGSSLQWDADEVNR